MVFLSKKALGMESIYGGECMRKPQCLKSLVFWSLFDDHSALFVRTSPVIFSLLVPTMHGQAQSVVSWKEMTFEVPFMHWKIPALNQVFSKWRGTTLVSVPKLEEMSTCEKNKGWFHEWSHFGARVHSRIWWYSWSRKLPNSCLWCFWNGSFVLVIWNSSVLLFPDMEKKELSCQIRLLLKEVPVCCAFHGMETPYTVPLHIELEATHWWISHNL